jgi:hypothetical protein
VAVSFDVRAIVAARWELPGHAHVVPGAPAADGDRTYTETDEDADGGGLAATLALRLLP